MDMVSIVAAAASMCAGAVVFAAGYGMGFRCGGGNIQKPIQNKFGKKKTEKIPQNGEMEKVLGGISNILRYDGKRQD